MRRWNRVGRPVHRLQLGLERLDLAVEPNGRLPRGHLLDRRTYGVDLDQLPVGDLADARPAERLRLDEAEELQVAQGLPDRRLARAQLLGDARLDETLARPVAAAQNPLEEQLLDLLAQDHPCDHGHVSAAPRPRRSSR
jgi:hypothetical protein